MKAISVIFFISIVISCSKNNNTETLNLAASALDKQLISKQDIGKNYINEIKSEYISIKDNTTLKNKIGLLMIQMKAIDSISMNSIKQIDVIKKQILQIGGNKKLIIDSLSNPFLIDYQKISNPTSKMSVKETLQPQKSTELSPILKKLNKTLLHLPSKILNVMCTYGDYKPLFPVIKNFQDEKELEKLLESKIDRKTYNYKEEGVIVCDIYKLLARNQNHNNIHWLNEYFDNTTTIEAIIRLNLLQINILNARNLAFISLSAKINRCGYGFTEIIPIVNGPSTAKEGEMVTIKVSIGAFDETNNPTIELSKMKEATIQYKDGLAYITFPAQKGVQTVSGIVAIKNKSGVKKELNFEWKLFGE